MHYWELCSAWQAAIVGGLTSLVRSNIARTKTLLALVPIDADIFRGSANCNDVDFAIAI
jgi:hypothetical protein